MKKSLREEKIFKDFTYLFLERGEGREKERERNINVWLPLMWPPTGHLAHNPGMCPDSELNRRPFGLQVSTPFTESHQPGLCEEKNLKDFIYLSLERKKAGRKKGTENQCA